jgi:hypothetical protein
MRLPPSAAAGLLVLALAQSASGAPARRSPSRTAESVTLYTIKKGDTLGAIAARYMIGRDAVAAVVAYNDIVDPDRAPVGTVLKIPTRLLKSTPLALTAVAVTGPVTRAAATGAAGPLAKGDAVVEGDRISTGADAFATLVKPDGSRITLPSHTILRVAAFRHIALDASDRGDLEIESGKGELSITPLRQPADRFEIRTPGSVAAVRGTEFRVAYDTDLTRATLEVLHGRVGDAAVGSAASVDIVTGQAAQRVADGERRVTPLPPAPAFAPPDEADAFPDVVFKIADPHPGWSYHIVLARDAAFTDLFAEVTAADGVARFDNIPLAPISARITAIDENGVEGFPRTYLVERPPPPGPTSGG